MYMFNNEEEVKKEEAIVEESKQEETVVEESKQEETISELTPTVEDKEKKEASIEGNESKENLDDKPKNNEKKDGEKKDHSFKPVSKDLHPDKFNPFERPVNPRFANKREQEFEERVLQIKRVIKVTKGGRRFKFSALVVIGDKKGRVGYAIGKHIEVPEAIKKAVRQAKKNITTIKISGKADTIPHEAIGHKGAARVMLKPAVEGKGIIASDVVRAVVELAGYRNIYSKNLGTNNPLNVVIATTEALKNMRTKEDIEALKSSVPRKPNINKQTNPKKQIVNSNIKSIDEKPKDLKEAKGE